jgi:capsular polysaccharide biosynthesis protein
VVDYTRPVRLPDRDAAAAPYANGSQRAHTPGDRRSGARDRQRPMSDRSPQERAGVPSPPGDDWYEPATAADLRSVRHGSDEWRGAENGRHPSAVASAQHQDPAAPSENDWPGPFEVAWEHRRELGLIAVCVGIVAFVLSTLVPAVYEAETTLAFPASALGLTGGDSERTRVLRTEAAQMTSLNLLREVSAQLENSPPAEDLFEQVEAMPSGDADLITVRATATTAPLAAEIADAVATVYTDRLNRRLQGRVDKLTEEVQALNQRASEQQDRVSDLILEAAAAQTGLSPDNDPDVAAARQRLETTLAQKFDKQQQLNDATADAERGSAVQTLAPATVPVAPLRPRPFSYALTAVLLAVLGVVTVRWWRADAAPTTVSDVGHIEELLGAPAVAVVPHLETPAMDGHVVTDAMTEAVDGYRLLVATGVLRGAVMVTAAGEGASCSVLTRNLASVLARDGWRPLIVAGDRDSGRARAGDMPGLTELLAGAPLYDCVRTADAGGGSIMGRVPWGSGPSTVLHQAGSDVAATLRELVSVADVALIDGPSLVSSPNAVVWAAHADAIVPVVTLGTPLAELRRFRARLDQLHRHVTAVVVQDRDRRPSTSRFRGRRSSATRPIAWGVPQPTHRER